jgi:hypothetical protein
MQHPYYLPGSRWYPLLLVSLSGLQTKMIQIMQGWLLSPVLLIDIVDVWLPASSAPIVNLGHFDTIAPLPAVSFPGASLVRCP